MQHFHPNASVVCLNMHSYVLIIISKSKNQIMKYCILLYKSTLYQYTKIENCSISNLKYSIKQKCSYQFLACRDLAAIVFAFRGLFMIAAIFFRNIQANLLIISYNPSTETIDKDAMIFSLASFDYN